MASTFYYFGYGSNMLAKRIHIQNPSARRLGVGILKDYRLDFHNFSTKWNGAQATVVASTGDIVYGAIWEIDICHIKDLDDQELVHQNVYAPISLPIYSLNLEKPLECRCYCVVNQPTTHLKSFTVGLVPFDRQPSKTYLKTLIKGGLETGIPDHYIDWLKTVQHNSNVVEELDFYLELHSVEL